ncbi:MAG: CBS domain-containing protein [bacterium]
MTNTTITVKELLRTKSREIWSVSPHATAYEALEIMADKNIGALLVMEDGRLAGIFSERDYARKVILKGKSSKDTAVSELMTTSVVYVTPDNTIEDCMGMMTLKQIRHLPVLNNGRLEGILTLGDVVKRIISEQEFTIRQLEYYVYNG